MGYPATIAYQVIRFDEEKKNTTQTKTNDFIQSLNFGLL